MIKISRLQNILNKFPKLKFQCVNSTRYSTCEDLSKDKNQGEDKRPEHGVPADDDFMKVSGKVQIAVIGGGRVPIYVSAILKQYPMVKSVHLIDAKHMLLKKAARDLSYVDTSTKIKYYTYSQLSGECLTEVLCNTDLVAIMDEDDYKPQHETPQEKFCMSGSYVVDTAKILAVVCPKALVVVCARPVTANTPLVYEVYNNYGQCHPRKIIGSVAVETMRIESATAELLGLDPSCMSIPIVAGADVCSCVPLLSQAKKFHQFSKKEEDYLLEHLRTSEKDICESFPAGPVFSTAVSNAKFILTVASGLLGSKSAKANAFVRSRAMPLCNYFSSPVSFCGGGVGKVHSIPKANEREHDLLEDSINTINECENLAREFVDRQFLKENDCKFARNMKCC